MPEGPPTVDRRLPLRSAGEACDAQTTLVEFYKSEAGWGSLNTWLNIAYSGEGRRGWPVLEDDNPAAFGPTGDKGDETPFYRYLASSGRVVTADEFQDVILMVAGKGECVWASASVTELIASAAAGLEGEMLRRDDPPSIDGIIWIEGLIDYVTEVSLPEDTNFARHQGIDIAAIGWSVSSKGVTVYMISDVWKAEPVIIDMWGWDFDRPWRQCVGDEKPQRGENGEPTLCSAHTAPVRRWLLALWRFMAQEIVEVTPSHAGRAAHRRAQRSGRTGGVRVVHLRRVHHPDSPRGESEAREWACRWWVDGHWRTLHRGTPQQRKTFVRPYIKGPEDKPIKPTDRRIVSVER